VRESFLGEPQNADEFKGSVRLRSIALPATPKRRNIDRANPTNQARNVRNGRRVRRAYFALKFAQNTW
jgi:hypothetical protein